ncbi:MAG: YHYH protein [Cyanobacteria bacterium P01_F01_bin.53]
MMTANLGWNNALRLLGLLAISGGLLQASSLVNQVSIEEREGYRYIYANGIPDHATGAFPNPGNPNTISAQEHMYRVTLNPQLTGNITPVRPAFGVALNGVPFEPGTGEFWNRDRSSGWNFEALTGFIDLGTDEHNAHVQPTGSYHYHGVPTALVPTRTMTHIGYGADGFPVYGPYGYADANNLASELIDVQSSYRLKAGLRPDGPGGLHDGTFSNDFEYVVGLGDLDECNGRFGVTPEYPEGIYHYYITDMFPFIPRCVKGTPDESFRSRGGSNGGPGGDRPPGSNRPEGRPEERPEGPPPGERPPGRRPPRGR